MRPADPIVLYLWHLSGVAPSDLTAFDACLSAEERARADRFVRAADGLSYRVGRGRMRQILARWVGGTPEVLRFRTGRMGKPYLERGPMFNLSHSGGLACLAVHPDRRLGVDIEMPRPVEEGVARRFFSPREHADLSSLSPDDWQDAFFRCWTRKEAVVKATGIGMGARLDAFDVTLLPSVCPQVTRMDTGDTPAWQLTHLDIQAQDGRRWSGAVAVPDPKGPMPVEIAEQPEDLRITCA
ncbi:4'-phosphopantetheinyl transferase superfamily protein [Jannaschia sp. 2305UL9-9]|uniref:4'-phosphopantetheinyl transferase family protein n=1 Tax=Jannaschia sp. 2305UL9-9 TaxID=3121638 RepID=UPI003529368B